MNENLELDFSHRPPEVCADEVEAVCVFLQGKGWIKAKVIEAEIEIDDRRMRVLAEQSEGRIISGNDGYRYFDDAPTIPEANRSADRLISQGKKMIRRGIAIRRRVHEIANRR